VERLGRDQRAVRIDRAAAPAARRPQPLLLDRQLLDADALKHPGRAGARRRSAGQRRTVRSQPSVARERTTAPTGALRGVTTKGGRWNSSGVRGSAVAE